MGRVRYNEQLAAALGPDAPSVVTCDSGCRTQWERAQVWVAQHSKWKIQQATDVLIDTFNPVDGGYGFRVTKTPTGQPGRYRIELLAACGSGKLEGCYPTEDLVMRAFSRYIATGDDVLTRVGAGYSIR